MTSGKIKIPRALLWASIASFIALIAGGIGVYALAIALPSTPVSKLFYFLKLNNFYYAAYLTKYFRTLSFGSGLIDAYVATPISMAVSALVFGVIFSSHSRGLRAIWTWAAAYGLFYSLLILGGSAAVNVFVENSIFSQQYILTKLVEFDRSYFLNAALQLVVWVAVYVLFAGLGSVIPRAQQRKPEIKAKRRLAQS